MSKAKEKALDFIKLEKKWIVFHDRDGLNLDSIETSYHAFNVVEVAVDIAIKEAKKEILLDIVKRKFKGKIRDFFIWYGRDFKDVDLEEEN